MTEPTRSHFLPGTQIQFDEIWKPIPFAPKHLASSKGRVMGLRGKPLVLIPNHRDYLVVNLHKIQYRVNRIICWTFHGEPPSNKHEAAHKDGKKQNNIESNLYWATSQQNADDLKASGVNDGINHWHSMFTEDQIRYIRVRFDAGHRVSDIAREFPLFQISTIDHIARRRSYRSVE